MNDPRRRPDAQTSHAKNAALAAAIGIGGLKLSARMRGQVELIHRAAEHARKQAVTEYEPLQLLYADERMNQILPRDELSEHLRIAVDRKDMYDWRKEFVPETAVMGPEMVEQYRPALWEAVVPDTQPEALGETAVRASRMAASRLNKDYVGLLSLVADAGLEIERVQDKGLNYVIHVYDYEYGKRVPIELPKWRSGIISFNNRPWIHKPKAALVSGDVVTYSYGASVMNDLKGSLPGVKEWSKGSYPSVADAVRAKIEGATRFKVEEFVQGNSINALTGMKMFRSETAQASQEWYRDYQRNRVLGFNRLYEGSPVYELDLDPSGKMVRRYRGIASVLGVSEGSFIKNTYGTIQPFMNGPLTRRDKQSSFRINWAKGKGYLGKKYTPGEFASKLGFLPIDYARHLRRHYQEEIPGRLANVGFYFGDVKGIADGSTAFVLQKTSSNRYNIQDFEYQKQKIYTLMGEDDSGKITRHTQALHEKWRYGTEIGRPAYVRKGDILGVDPASQELIRAEFSGYVTNSTKTGNMVEFEVHSTESLARGYKTAETKTVVDVVYDVSDLPGVLHKEHEALGKYLEKFRGAHGIEFLMNMNQTKHYRGGAFGLGVVQKVLQDLADTRRQQIFGQAERMAGGAKATAFRKEFADSARRIIGSMIGNEAVHSLYNVNVTDDFSVAVTLRKGVTTEHSAFRRLLTMEDMIRRAENTGNWDEFKRWIIEVEKDIQGIHGMKNYRMAASMDSLAAVMRNDPRTLAPFVFDKGAQGNKGGLIFAAIRTVTTGHETNSYDIRRTSSLRRVRRGYIGGLKLTSDIERNYRAMGLSHMARYVQTLRDHNLTYIFDKYQSPETFLLKSDMYTKSKTNYIQLGRRTMSIREANLQNLGQDILTKLAEGDETAQILKVYSGFKMTYDNLTNLIGHVDEEMFKQYAQGGLVDIDDLLASGRLGFGGNSVMLVEDKVMKEYMKLVNKRHPDELVYLKLPFEIEHRGVKGDMLQLLTQDPGDIFPLLATQNRLGQPVADDIKRRFYTMSRFGQEQLSLVQKVAAMDEEIRVGNVSERRREEMIRDLEHSVRTFNDGVKRAFSSKDSPATEALTSVRAPFTMQGQIRAATGLGLDEVGIHPDDLVRIVTGGRVKSLDEAKGFMELREELESIAKLTNIDDIKSMDNDVYKRLLAHTDPAKKGRNSFAGALRRYLGKERGEQLFGMFRLAMEGTRTSESKYKMRQALKGARHFADTAILTMDDEGFLYHRAYEIHKRMAEGSLSLNTEVVRFPILSTESTRTLRAVLYNDDGISTNAAKQIGKRYFQHAAKGHLYMLESTAAAFKGDFDSDFANMMILAMDRLQEIDEEIIKRTGVTPSDGVTILESLKMRPEGIKGLSLDSVKALVQRNLVYEEGGVIRPANSASVTMVAALEDEKYQGRVQKVRLDKYLDTYLDSMLTDEYRPQLGRYRSRLKKELVKHATELHGTRVPELFVVTGISEAGPEHVRRLSRTEKEAKIARLYPEELQNALSGKTRADRAVFQKVTESSKETFEQFKRDVIDRQVERFGEMKIDTPKASKINDAIQTLSDVFARNERDREFFRNLGSEILAQNTISLKHGTPSYLSDMVSTLKKLSGGRGDVLQSVKEFERLANANFRLNFSETDRREIIKWGFADEKTKRIDWDQYDRYLTSKNELLGELMEAHNAASLDLAREIGRGEASVTTLQKRYRNLVEGRMQHFKLNGVSLKERKFQFQDWHFSRDTVTHALTEAETAVKNNAKNRAKSRTADRMWKGMHERMARMLSVFRETYGEDITNYPTYKALFRYEAIQGLDESHVPGIIERMEDQARDARVIDAPTHEDRMVARAAAFIHGRKDMKIRRVNTVRAEERIQTLKYRELKELKQRFADSTREGGTIFRRGSLVESLAGKVNRAGASSLENEVLQKISKVRGGAILAGLFLGAVGAQLLNQEASGYPVPGLENMAGLGGEYHEHHAGSREWEAFLSPKPARVTPWYNEDNRLSLDMIRMMNVQDASTYGRAPSRYSQSIKGVVVR